jgi:hypothetical protein
MTHDQKAADLRLEVPVTLSFTIEGPQGSTQV